MLARLRDRFMATLRPPVTDPETRRAVDAETRAEMREARLLAEVHRIHREQNHIAQRIAAAYGLEPRWK